jgi:glyoxylase-like metal-dependent hydrolase (beta-lactamase superfamily II)
MKGGCGMEPVLIDIKQEIPGFSRFFGCWLYQNDKSLIVDVGPANSVHHLIAALKERHVDCVDYVLITHIHIDHVGGLYDILEAFPTAKAVVHSKGVRHLMDPSRLWEGSQMVLGKMAEDYGPLKFIREERLIAHPEVNLSGLDIIETPGHASHHLAFCYGGFLFAGEAGGNFYRLGDMEYLRPATPPVFFLQDFLDSIDRLLALNDQPILYAHYGRAESSHHMLIRFHDQLLRWKEIISEEMAIGENRLVERCVERLFKEDPELQAFDRLDPESQKREIYFSSNSVRGYLGYLRKGSGPKKDR